MTATALRRVLSAVLLVALVVAVAGLVAFVVTPFPASEPYTEFYVLGPDGTAGGYPSTLAVGESGRVIVGITNNEHERATYRLVVETDAETLVSREVTVADGETWEETIEFSFDSPGERRVALLLYLDGETAYRETSLRLVVEQQ